MKTKAEVLSVKEEKFCQLIASGACKDQSDAYRKAFRPRRATKKTINEEASRLKAEYKITARINELMLPVISRVRVTREQWLDKMQSFFHADVRKMFVGPGQPVEVSELGDDEALLIEGYEVTENFEKVGDKAEHVGYTTKVKLTKSLNRMLEFGKVMGWYDDHEQDKGPTRVFIRKWVTQEVKHVHVHSNGHGAHDNGVRDDGGIPPTSSAGTSGGAMASDASGGGGTDRLDASAATSTGRTEHAGLQQHVQAASVSTSSAKNTTADPLQHDEHGRGNAQHELLLTKPRVVRRKILPAVPKRDDL